MAGPTSDAKQYHFVSPDPGPRTIAPPAASQELLHSGARVYASPALRKFARELGVDLANMARFKVPKTVVFGPLPKTSTGKMQKYVLRERAAEL